MFYDKPYYMPPFLGFFMKNVLRGIINPIEPDFDISMQ